MQLTLYEKHILSSQDQFFCGNSASQIPTRNLKKLVLRMIKFVFHKEKLDPIDTVYEKHILSFSRGAFHGILTWWNLKGLAKLANLTVANLTVQ